MPRLRRAAHPLSAPGVGRGRGCPGLRRPGQAEPPRATGGTRTRTRSPPAPAARSPLPVPSCSGGAGWLSVGSGFSCACVLAQSPASGLRMLPGFVPLLLPLGSSFFFFFASQNAQTGLKLLKALHRFPAFPKSGTLCQILAPCSFFKNLMAGVFLIYFIDALYLLLMAKLGVCTEFLSYLTYFKNGCA